MADECTQSAIAGVNGAASACHSYSHRNDGIVIILVAVILILALRKGRSNGRRS